MTNNPELDLVKQIREIKMFRRVILGISVVVFSCLIVGAIYFVRALRKTQVNTRDQIEALNKASDSLLVIQRGIQIERMFLQEANKARNLQAERILNAVDKIDIKITNLEKRQNEAINNVRNMSDAELRQYFSNLNEPTR